MSFSDEVFEYPEDESKKEWQRREIETRLKYQALFGSPVGKDVLADILRMLKWGEQIVEGDNYGVACHNLGTAILIKCGYAATGSEIINNMLGTHLPASLT